MNSSATQRSTSLAARPLGAALLILAAACLGLAGPAFADGLSRREAAQLKRQIAQAAGEDNWNQVGALLTQLAAANDKKTFSFMVKVVEKSPRRAELHLVLRDAIATMDDRRVQEEIADEARDSKSADVRRMLVLHCANQKNWDVLIEAIEDDDEQVAALAAWRLVDARVERAVEPMIDRMAELERGKEGIWDVLRNGLGELLGGRSQMAIEYRSRWDLLKGKGGLSAVEREEDRREPAGELASGVRLFGRQIDCTRVVFVLDVSGSMEAKDPDQQRYDDDASSRARGGGASEGRSPGDDLLTRLERAQRQLKKVLEKLPAAYKVNIVAYSTRVQMWHANEGDRPPQLYPLTDEHRADAIEFVEKFRSQGVTATDDALRRAFDVENVRCIYLLSDGFATHDGQSKIPTDEILALVEGYKDRHVTIHTLGFKQADVQMMRAVAEATGGEYSDIR